MIINYKYYKVIPYLILTYFSVLFGNIVLANSEEEFAFIAPSHISLYQDRCFTFSSELSYEIESKDPLGNYLIVDPHTEVRILVTEDVVVDKRYLVERWISNPIHIELDLENVSALEGLKRCFEPTAPLKVLKFTQDADQEHFGVQEHFLVSSQNRDGITAVWVPREHLKEIHLSFFDDIDMNFDGASQLQLFDLYDSINVVQQLQQSFQKGTLPPKNDILGLRNIKCVDSKVVPTARTPPPPQYMNNFITYLLIGLEDNEGGLHLFIDRDHEISHHHSRRFYKNKGSIINIEAWEEGKRIELLETLKKFIANGFFQSKYQYFAGLDFMYTYVNEQEIIEPAKAFGPSYAYSLKLRESIFDLFGFQKWFSDSILSYQIRKSHNYLVIKQIKRGSDGLMFPPYFCYGKIKV